MNIIFKKMRKTFMENEKIFYINQNSTLKPVIKLYMCGITYPYKNYGFARRKSRYAVIEYIEKGTGILNIGDKTFYPSEGDSYLLQPGTTHDYHSDEENPWKKYFINFGGPLAEKMIEAYNMENISYFPGLDLKKELQDIINIARNPKEECTSKIVGCINRMFTKMFLEINADRYVPEIAKDMKNFLNSRITSSFTIKELCDFVSKSESQTINIFKKAYGVTPYAYVLSKKISFAKTMLANTNLSVKEVAYNLNFTDEYYFSNVFKNKVGTSPTNYRKTHRSK